MKNDDYKAQRADINYLISAEAADFDLYGAMEAAMNLADSIDDINFQLLDVPQAEFKGRDYDKWKTGASFKRNKLNQAYRRFRLRVRELMCG